MEQPPLVPPIGLRLARTARHVSGAFDAALSAAGGSTPTWSVLVLLRAERWGTQSQLADAMGIRGATLTHHLSRMEADGLVARRRDPGNRRIQLVAVTPAGAALFERLRSVATAFDEALRGALTAEELAALADALDRLRAATPSVDDLTPND